MPDKTVAELLEDNRLVVWSPVQARILFNDRFYGKPLGIPRPTEDFNAPLLLDPVEALYLLEKKEINIRRQGKNLSEKNFRKILETTFDSFHDKYLVYRGLRERGYVVTPGIKYGCDFAVYEEGPGRDHAPYVVQIMKKEEVISASEIVKAGRLASTVRKAFIIAVVNGEVVRFIEFNWWRA
ncbi:tRNA-intron lyase [Candidatus Bathyarchaeota archaeon]|nr:tRNA-intron lyase [Candidatus Bathyarchaeota archaeon]MBT4424070.1 tRNA-intron lyase [Candidatus Bathyarchaeota archaeon]MBT6604045.1 tRNA-intron lyase [Candidatus Bathyarchaeota archaeon]MBT7188330.1 tRNA-intron lyase [Candidatus Bathyarchaeota archaeon]MBT7345930.1 tRNA-intron lyase [Candidatus Bathyarchaeota archaeon]